MIDYIFSKTCKKRDYLGYFGDTILIYALIKPRSVEQITELSYNVSE